MSRRKSKYDKVIRGQVIDVYDVINAYEITNPALQHAVKKALMPGQRGGKSVVQDLEEAIHSLQRAIDIEKEAEEARYPEEVGVSDAVFLAT